MSTANIILNNFLASYGDIPVAAMGVAMKANMLVILVQIGLGSGVAPLIGYCYGSGNLEKMKKTMKFSMACNVIMGTVLSLLTEPIIQAFINDGSVVAHGVRMLRVLMISGPVIGIMFVFMFGFQAMGKAIPSLILSLSRQGLVFFPVLLITNYLFGLEGIVFAQPVADLASLGVSFLLFIKIAKELKEREKELELQKAEA